MMIKYLAALFCVWPIGCYSETGHSPNPAQLSQSDCQKIVVNHKAAPGVAYTPGVGVSGKKVVSGDLMPPQSYKISENTFVDLKTLLGPFVPNTAGMSPATMGLLGDSDLHIGEINIKENGDVIINGEAVNQESKDKIASACRATFPGL